MFSGNLAQLEVVHPNWPTIWPRMLTDGKSIEVDEKQVHHDTVYDYT